MALARTYGVALNGVRGQLVEIQADVSGGIPGLAFTGLADKAVTESRERIRAAVINSNISWPAKRMTVALLPADVAKSGSRFDLAMTMALLAAFGELPVQPVADTVWIAELGLDGQLRPVRGALPAVLAAKAAGLAHAVVAPGNGAEAGLVPGIDVRVAESVGALVAWLRGEGPPPAAAEPGSTVGGAAGKDLADVAGQTGAKRALEIAAAGAHNLFLLGVPGAGKTMLAERLPGVLPLLDDDAAVEVTAIHSVAGLLPPGSGLIRRPPLQAPHHTASVASLVGGGSGLGRPGAISLAHRGILFLDEVPEFGRDALEALRQPLESGEVVVHRVGGAISYPARFQLLLAANPCPCGSRSRDCVCPPNSRRRYLQRLSGPLLDRIDLRVQVDPVRRADFFDPAEARETSASVAQRVMRARAAAVARWSETGWLTNAEVPGARLRRRPWALPRSVLAPAEEHLDKGVLSARGLDRVLRVAWTVADLCGHVSPTVEDMHEALFFRTGETSAWAA